MCATGVAACASTGGTKSAEHAYAHKQDSTLAVNCWIQRTPCCLARADLVEGGALAGLDQVTLDAEDIIPPQ